MANSGNKQYLHTHINGSSLRQMRSNRRHDVPHACLLVRVGVLHLPVVGISNQPAEGQSCPGKLLPSDEAHVCQELLGRADISIAPRLGIAWKTHAKSYMHGLHRLAQAHVQGHVGVILVHVQAHIFTSFVPAIASTADCHLF